MPYISFDPEAWMLSANCLGRTDLFFAPDDSETRAERRYRESQAKSVCHDCVVRVECLSEALRSDERFGIWGGLTERERRSVRRTHQDSPYTAATNKVSPQDIAGPGRLARLPAVVVQGRAMSFRGE
jgi:WhiB family transcriptional regulator, redox-sensing transcriptional regulator